MTLGSALLLAYLALNFLAFVTIFLDKWASRKRHRRISERTLLILALLGPFGAMAGMLAFHHKTRKRKFLLVPLFLAIHLVLLISVVIRPI